MVTVTVRGPVATAEATLVMTGPVSAEALCAAKLATTAAESQVVPLWNTRLGRRVIFHTV
jgi:hypothetical protein